MAESGNPKAGEAKNKGRVIAEVKMYKCRECGKGTHSSYDKKDGYICRSCFYDKK